ncbi:hypothetical protein BD413DRAFT_312128 [Trametes elegans]|nr:hypothetical protein BD413DRAFT_312128 [Trametes elegans]
MRYLAPAQPARRPSLITSPEPNSSGSSVPSRTDTNELASAEKMSTNMAAPLTCGGQSKPVNHRTPAPFPRGGHIGPVKLRLRLFCTLLNGDLQPVRALCGIPVILKVASSRGGLLPKPCPRWIYEHCSADVCNLGMPLSRFGPVKLVRVLSAERSLPTNAATRSREARATLVQVRLRMLAYASFSPPAEGPLPSPSSGSPRRAHSTKPVACCCDQEQGGH